MTVFLFGLLPWGAATVASFGGSNFIKAIIFTTVYMIGSAPTAYVGALYCNILNQLK